MPAESPYAYLALGAALFAVWALLYAVKAGARREMARISAGTMVLGLTEPLFVPAYWNPPTLFDLARRTGFDLESLLFSFAIGGIVFTAYDVIVRTGPLASIAGERGHPRHRYHLVAVGSVPAAFVLLVAATALNPIYAAAIALVWGFAATWYCRPDLGPKMLVSGWLFLGVYFLVFALFDRTFPGYVESVWNLPAISGIMVLGVPAEELMFAFTFGLYWSSVYEHFTWRRAARR